jgi:MFS family permease
VLLTSMGLSGVGDAPDPHDSSASTAAHFLAKHDDVLTAAAFGLVAAALVGAFLLGLARRLVRAGAPSAAVGVGVGAAFVAMYFAGLHAVYTSLSAYVAEASPEAAKGLFVLTIMATPAFGAAIALVLGSAALGAWRSGSLPAWWCGITAGAALLAVVAVGSYADSGWFYPDVQQQVVGNILLLWLLVTSVVLAVRARGGRSHRR